MASSPPLSLSWRPLPLYPTLATPEATLARARLNSGDLTAVERSGAALNHLFPRSDPIRLIQIELPGPRDTASRTHA
jgi:hypothetical protein